MKKWNKVSTGIGVFQGLKFEDRLCKKHQIERESMLRNQKTKSTPRINILIDKEENTHPDRPKRTRRKAKSRPKTAKNSRIPRYLQPIHGKAIKEDNYDISNFYYRDLLLVRFRENQRAEIYNEKQFTNVFLLRNNDPFWQALDYMQSNVKAQVGLGTPIIIKFYADLGSKHPEHPDRLHYNFSKFGEDREITDEFVYCLKLCYKICEYLQRVHLFEVLKMCAQFSKDDDGKIFLVYVKDLHIRKVPYDFERHIIMEEVHNLNKQAKDHLVKEINSHLDNSNSQKKIHSIYNVMNNHYGGVKHGIGIGDLYQDNHLETEHDRVAQNAYNTLRPQSPYKLSELTNKKDFKEKKYIKARRVEEKNLGGRCMFRSHAIKDPEDLRKAILQGEVYVTSPKKFLSKKDFANLKQESRLMHQFYSKNVNAPVELNKEFRFLKKDHINMKAIKKSISTGCFGNSTKDDKLMMRMSKKIIDFSHGGIDLKKKPLKANKSIRPSSFGRTTPDMSFHQKYKTNMRQGLRRSKRTRPKSGRISTSHRRNKGFSRLTTQGSYSSSKLGLKQSMSRTRESHIKYLAENKESHIADIAAIV